MASDRKSSLKKIAKLMGKLDLCMLITHDGDGGMRGRPMSNNGEVEFNGDVWFFSAADSRKVADIEDNEAVVLSYADLESYRFVSMTGYAEIVQDKAKKVELWMDELERWFEDGPESDDVVLIKVTPTAVSYWGAGGDDDEGEIILD